MPRPAPLALPSLALLALAAMPGAGIGAAQEPRAGDAAAAARVQLAGAAAQGAAARRRAEQYEAAASRAAAAVDRTVQSAAAVAARIQEAEAAIAANQARIALIAQQRAALRAQLAERQQPVVELTAALERLARRPALLALLRPGALTEAVHLRAVLAAMTPEIDRRTAGLRAAIAQNRALQQQAAAATLARRAGQRDLASRRAALAALETRQRLAARQASGAADREADRALALAERARDLAALADELDAAAALRARLAALPGPVARPALPSAAQVRDLPPAPLPAVAAPRIILPVAGPLVTGFGDARPGQPRSRGVAIAARPGAQAVAPAPGRVVFAAPYQGYGNIVIIEHPGGWTSLVTGLAMLDTAVGSRLVAGSPLGTTGAGRPVVTVELRRSGEPVNPLDYLAS